MFDQQFYNTVFQGLHGLLRNNIAVLGEPFANQLLAEHDPRKGPQAQQNAQDLLNWIGQETQRANGNNQIRGEQQLYSFLGPFIQEMHSRFMQQNNRFGGGGVGQQQSRFQTSNFNNGNMGGGMNSGFGMGNTQVRMSGGSYVGGDDPAPAQTTIAPARSGQASPVLQTTPTAPLITWSNNPLDEATDANFSPVKGAANWGAEMPKDARIVVAKHDVMKSQQGLSIHRFESYHQLIQNDPVQVVRDFFDIVPDSTLGMPFLFQVDYNHLEVIEVPTQEFQIIRSKCIDALAQNTDKQLHKHIFQVLNTMQVGSYKAITAYLVKQVNRALYLACRLSTMPKIMIAIETYEDLDTLLSSEFSHPFTTHSEGRYSLEKIITAALWNALVMNSAALFADGEVPTAAMQLSPAFPFSMEGVYPNKFAIPSNDHGQMGLFKEQLQKKELVNRTYVISRRSVIITNILGKLILPQIGKEASPIDNPIGKILGNYALPFIKEDLSASDGDEVPNTFLPEDFSVDQFSEYLSKTDWATREADRFRLPPVTLPVDRTVFAIQYGMRPEKYLQGMDILSTFDTPAEKPRPLFAKHAYPGISPL